MKLFTFFYYVSGVVGSSYYTSRGRGFNYGTEQARQIEFLQPVSPSYLDRDHFWCGGLGVDGFFPGTEGILDDRISSGDDENTILPSPRNSAVSGLRELVGKIKHPPPPEGEKRDWRDGRMRRFRRHTPKAAVLNLDQYMLPQERAPIFREAFLQERGASLKKLKNNSESDSSGTSHVNLTAYLFDRKRRLEFDKSDPNLLGAFKPSDLSALYFRVLQKYLTMVIKNSEISNAMVSVGELSSFLNNGRKEGLTAWFLLHGGWNVTREWCYPAYLSLLGLTVRSEEGVIWKWSGMGRGIGYQGYYGMTNSKEEKEVVEEIRRHRTERERIVMRGLMGGDLLEGGDNWGLGIESIRKKNSKFAHDIDAYLDSYEGDDHGGSDFDSKFKAILRRIGILGHGPDLINQGSANEFTLPQNLVLKDDNKTNVVEESPHELSREVMEELDSYSPNSGSDPSDPGSDSPNSPPPVPSDESILQSRLESLRMIKPSPKARAVLAPVWFKPKYKLDQLRKWVTGLSQIGLGKQILGLGDAGKFVNPDQFFYESQALESVYHRATPWMPESVVGRRRLLLGDKTSPILDQASVLDGRYGNDPKSKFLVGLGKWRGWWLIKERYKNGGNEASDDPRLHFPPPSVEKELEENNFSPPMLWNMSRTATVESDGSNFNSEKQLSSYSPHQYLKTHLINSIVLLFGCGARLQRILQYGSEKREIDAWVSILSLLSELKVLDLLYNDHDSVGLRRLKEGGISKWIFNPSAGSNEEWKRSQVYVVNNGTTTASTKSGPVTVTTPDSDTAAITRQSHSSSLFLRQSVPSSYYGKFPSTSGLAHFIDQCPIPDSVNAPIAYHYFRIWQALDVLFPVHFSVLSTALMEYETRAVTAGIHVGSVTYTGKNLEILNKPFFGETEVKLDPDSGEKKVIMVEKVRADKVLVEKSGKVEKSGISTELKEIRSFLLEVFDDSAYRDEDSNSKDQASKAPLSLSPFFKRYSNVNMKEYRFFMSGLAGGAPDAFKRETLTTLYDALRNVDGNGVGLTMLENSFVTGGLQLQALRYGGDGVNFRLRELAFLGTNLEFSGGESNWTFDSGWRLRKLLEEEVLEYLAERAIRLIIKEIILRTEKRTRNNHTAANLKSVNSTENLTVRVTVKANYSDYPALYPEGGKEPHDTKPDHGSGSQNPILQSLSPHPLDIVGNAPLSDSSIAAHLRWVDVGVMNCLGWLYTCIPFEEQMWLPRINLDPTSYNTEFDLLKRLVNGVKKIANNVKTITEANSSDRKSSSPFLDLVEKVLDKDYSKRIRESELESEKMSETRESEADSKFSNLGIAPLSEDLLLSNEDKVLSNENTDSVKSESIQQKSPWLYRFLVGTEKLSGPWWEQKIRAHNDIQDRSQGPPTGRDGISKGTGLDGIQGSAPTASEISSESEQEKPPEVETASASEIPIIEPLNAPPASEIPLLEPLGTDMDFLLVFDSLEHYRRALPQLESELFHRGFSCTITNEMSYPNFRTVDLQNQVEDKVWSSADDEGNLAWSNPLKTELKHFNQGKANRERYRLENRPGRIRGYSEPVTDLKLRDSAPMGLAEIASVTPTSFRDGILEEIEDSDNYENSDNYETSESYFIDKNNIFGGRSFHLDKWHNSNMYRPRGRKQLRGRKHGVFRKHPLNTTVFLTGDGRADRMRMLFRGNVQAYDALGCLRYGHEYVTRVVSEEEMIRRKVSSKTGSDGGDVPFAIPGWKADQMAFDLRHPFFGTHDMPSQKSAFVHLHMVVRMKDNSVSSTSSSSLSSGTEISQSLNSPTITNYGVIPGLEICWLDMRDSIESKGFFSKKLLGPILESGDFETVGNLIQLQEEIQKEWFNTGKNRTEAVSDGNPSTNFPMPQRQYKLITQNTMKLPQHGVLSNEFVLALGHRERPNPLHEEFVRGHLDLYPNNTRGEIQCVVAKAPEWQTGLNVLYRKGYGMVDLRRLYSKEELDSKGNSSDSKADSLSKGGSNKCLMYDVPLNCPHDSDYSTHLFMHGFPSKERIPSFLKKLTDEVKPTDKLKPPDIPPPPWKKQCFGLPPWGKFRLFTEFDWELLKSSILNLHRKGFKSAYDLILKPECEEMLKKRGWNFP